MLFLFTFLILFIVLILWCLAQIEKGKYGFDEGMYLNHLSGIPNVGENVRVMFYLYPNKISINNQQNIPFQRIKSTKIFSSQQLDEINKSIISRAVGGGILAGPIGAIIGGISGTGKKKVQRLFYFFSINYINIKGEDSTALFVTKDDLDLKRLSKISNTINEKIGCEERFNIKQQKSYEI